MSCTDDVAVAGATESHPIVISEDATDTETTVKVKTTRWSGGGGVPIKRTRPIPMQQQRKGLQKILGELPAEKRQKVENVFRAEVNKRRTKGEFVGEQEEINIYIEALGEIGKKQAPAKEKDAKDRKRDEKGTEEGGVKHKETGTGKSSAKYEQKTTQRSKLRTEKTVNHFDLGKKGKSSSNGKISLEGLSMAEKRITTKKALDEIPPFIASKVKSRQKLSVSKMKSEGKQVGETEEMDCMAEAFNHMFNEEGNIMAHVLKDQIFKRSGDFTFKRDSAVKQLNLPQFDEEVKRFRKLEQNKQAGEMKTLRESLSVLLKILLFKKQDKVFADAEKAKIELTKIEKNIIRYQILLDMTQAVVIKREEKEKGTENISAGEYQAEKEESQDEFDDDSDTLQTETKKNMESEALKRPLEQAETTSPKKVKISDTGDTPINADDDDVRIIEETEMTVQEEDEVDKLLKEVSSDDDDDDDVIIDEYDEAKLLEDIKESSRKDEDDNTGGEQAIDDSMKDVTNKGSQEEVENKTELESNPVEKPMQDPVQTLSDDMKNGDAAQTIETMELDRLEPVVSEDCETSKILSEDSEGNQKVQENSPDQDVGDGEANKKDGNSDSKEETEDSKEEKEAKLETVFREVLTPAQRRTILGRMITAKKARQAAGNEMSDEEVGDLRYKMIEEAVTKQAKASPSKTTPN